MDFETVIIGLVSVAFFLVPILYVQHVQKAKKNKIIEDFIKLGEQQQLTITQYDFWEPFYAIGIDTEKKKLLYTRNQAGNEQQELVDLAEIIKSGISKTSTDSGGNKVIERVDLALHTRTPKQQAKFIEFYSKEENLNFSNELLLSEKWNNIIQAHIAVKSPALPGQVYA
ncbi:hypothetical protein ACSX1A_05870 [Pontibacter sp. MBLB2868]|uniref:hypothetical protein n=1 Tax=Pontibacter sp. MBLB2868 TaxID=3451555 RepID=UPI003F750BB8